MKIERMQRKLVEQIVLEETVMFAPDVPLFERAIAWASQSWMFDPDVRSGIAAVWVDDFGRIVSERRRDTDCPWHSRGSCTRAGPADRCATQPASPTATHAT